jgi:hypothetical protein
MPTAVKAGFPVSPSSLRSLTTTSLRSSSHKRASSSRSPSSEASTVPASVWDIKDVLNLAIGSEPVKVEERRKQLLDALALLDTHAAAVDDSDQDREGMEVDEEHQHEGHSEDAKEDDGREKTSRKQIRRPRIRVRKLKKFKGKAKAKETVNQRGARKRLNQKTAAHEQADSACAAAAAAEAASKAAATKAGGQAAGKATGKKSVGRGPEHVARSKLARFCATTLRKDTPLATKWNDSDVTTRKSLLAEFMQLGSSFEGLNNVLVERELKNSKKECSTQLCGGQW